MSTDPFIVGIVGGVASGKSAVAARLVELGAERINADEIGHQLLVSDPIIRAKVVQRFGKEIVGPDGTIQRAAVAAKVFGNDLSTMENRRDLEAILHPAIRAETERRLAGSAAEDPNRIVILDAPLLIEAGWLPRCREVLFIDTPLELRRALAAKRGWSADEFARRESSQTSLDEKRRSATTTIPNFGNLRELHLRVDEIYRKLCSTLADIRKPEVF